MKKNNYYAAMNECVNAIVDAINNKRSDAEYYRSCDMYKDAETGEMKEWAKECALEVDALADEMEKILHTKFGV